MSDKDAERCVDYCCCSKDCCAACCCVPEIKPIGSPPSKVRDSKTVRDSDAVGDVCALLSCGMFGGGIRLPDLETNLHAPLSASGPTYQSMS